jgi:hypothetical protein
MRQTWTRPLATEGTSDDATWQLSRLPLRVLAGLLVALVAFLTLGPWQAPSAEARKKRERTPTTVAGESVSSTSVQAGATSSANGKTNSKPPKSGNVLVFPGAGKRDNTPTPNATGGSKPKPTLVASATPSNSAVSAGKVKNKTTANSNRTDPRLRAIGFRSRTKLEQHYQKHGREFGNISLEEYLAMAQDLRDAPLSNRVVEANQVGGTISRFDRKTGAFTAFNRDLTLRTFFKPNGGEDYFRRAATKSH